MSPTSRRVLRIGDPGVEAYPLLTALVVPRPIAWISTLDVDGVGNLAPHSFFTVASADPPIVQFTSVGHKDTLRNVRATGEFVVNVASEPLRDQVNDSSAPWPDGHDEARELSIAMEPSELVAPPRVAASPASLECRVHSEIDLGRSVVVLGDVLAVTVVEDALEGDHPSMAALRPLSRLGRDEWGLAPAPPRVPRPSSVGEVSSSAARRE
jgi:flavin reductase (DIM6/NTAB) family NADH-FMN oxidoreductase RutF